MSIGARISERRKELKMSQQDLADKLNLSFQAVSLWERDECLPETNRLIDIAEALSTKVSWLLEEDGAIPTSWELKDAMFSVDHMEKRVRDYARAKDMPETLKALRIMKKSHEGQFRKGKDKIPYIFHPLMLACHAFALNIDNDNLIATCLLHDVIEDCKISSAELDVNDEIREAVNLVSFKVLDGMTKEESKAVYYEKIKGNKIATMVKVLDRCNNVSTMATAFSRQKIASYIDETENYVMPLLDVIKHEYDDYYNAAFLIKYQISSLLETMKRLV